MSLYRLWQPYPDHYHHHQIITIIIWLPSSYDHHRRMITSIIWSPSSSPWSPSSYHPHQHRHHLHTIVITLSKWKFHNHIEPLNLNRNYRVSKKALFLSSLSRQKSWKVLAIRQNDVSLYLRCILSFSGQ